MRRSASVGWARGGQEGRGGRGGGGVVGMRALSGPTHFGPKFEAEMSAYGQGRTVLSVWVGPLDCGFSIFLSAQTHSDAGVIVWVGPLKMALGDIPKPPSPSGGEH
jgi:hypothetical protein